MISTLKTPNYEPNSTSFVRLSDGLRIPFRPHAPIVNNDVLAPSKSTRGSFPLRIPASWRLPIEPPLNFRRWPHLANHCGFAALRLAVRFLTTMSISRSFLKLRPLYFMEGKPLKHPEMQGSCLLMHINLPKVVWTWYFFLPLFHLEYILYIVHTSLYMQKRKILMCVSVQEQWKEMFACLISKGATVDVIRQGEGPSKIDGAIQLVSTHHHFLNLLNIYLSNPEYRSDYKRRK